MSTYLRESDRYDSTFPSIRNRTGILEPTQRSRITTLDDELLDSNVRGSRTTYTTTVQRSAPPGGRESPVFYPRPPSPGRENRKVMMELQDQVRLFRDELAKKDKLIAELTSFDVPRPTRIDTSLIDETFSQERINALANARSEIASLQVRIDGITSQLREAQVEIDRREGKIRELKIELETTRENEAKQCALVGTLRHRLSEYEATAGTLEGAASRSELAVQSLSKQNAELQDRIIDLESRIRRHLEDREAVETRTSSWERKYSEIIAHFTNIMHIDDISSVSTESVSAKLTEIVQENASLKGKLLTMKEYVNNAEVETKASRETIMRLVSEAEKEQRNNSRFSVEMDNLRVERDSAVARETELKREIDMLKERLESSHRAWQATRRELEEKESRFYSVESKVKENELFVRNSEMQLRSFREQLAGILSDPSFVVEPYEEQIRERIRTLTTDYKDRLAHVELLEGKLRDLTEQLDRQYEISKSADRRAKRMEGDYLSLEGRLRRVEDDAHSGEVLRDELRHDKERFLQFMERLCHVLNIDAITADVGLDMSFDSLLGRAEQLVKMEGDAIQDRKTHIYNLQRKIKSMKEQLESKDLHLDLMRKKVAGLEERLLGKSELEQEKDSEAMKSRKLIKLAEKYKRELEEANLEIRDLKAKLLESTEFKARSLEAENALDQLESKVGQLERVRQKQAKKIATLKDDFNMKDSEISMKKQSINNTIQALSSELKTTKAALDEITKRERQLLDLRQVIARMLGLNINNLAVPDYEIIARLEKLILAHQSGVITDAAIGTIVDDMEEGFRAGYQDAARVYTNTHHRTRSPTRKTTTLRTRTRSLSPSRRKDTRAY